MEIRNDDRTSNFQTRDNLEKFDPSGDRNRDLREGDTLKTGVQANQPLVRQTVYTYMTIFCRMAFPEKCSDELISSADYTDVRNISHLPYQLIVESE